MTTNGPQGIYEQASGFAEIFREIADAVVHVKPADVEQEQWDGIVHDIVLYAWKTHCADPKHFAAGPLRRWASRSARLLLLNRKRNDRRRATRREILVREFVAGHFDAETLDALSEEDWERQVVRAFQVLEPRWWGAAVGILIRRLSRRSKLAQLTTPQPALMMIDGGKHSDDEAAATPAAPSVLFTAPNFDFDNPDEATMAWLDAQWRRFCVAIGLREIPDIRALAAARRPEPPRPARRHWLVRPFRATYEWLHVYE